MFSKLIALISILLGLLWIFRPDILRGWATRKANWTLFWSSLFFLFYPLMHELKPKGLATGFVLFVLFVFLMARLGRRVGEAMKHIPPVCFQAVGLMNLLSGLFLILVKKP